MVTGMPRARYAHNRAFGSKLFRRQIPVVINHDTVRRSVRAFDDRAFALILMIGIAGEHHTTCGSSRRVRSPEHESVKANAPVVDPFPAGFEILNLAHVGMFPVGRNECASIIGDGLESSGQ